MVIQQRVTVEMVRSRVHTILKANEYNPIVRDKIRERIRSYRTVAGYPVERVSSLQEKDYESFYSLINIMN